MLHLRRLLGDQSERRAILLHFGLPWAFGLAFWPLCGYRIAIACFILPFLEILVGLHIERQMRKRLG